ncbi:hypothetical protein [Bdellovibrio sp. HCB209]|uniref:hypothetical protein n=1 Tax=Bdellovibrio sp. HCB209 TaxID=3394354 RepID=UPI0039B40E6B
MKSELLKLATSLSMIALLASCSQVSDNSLLTDDPSNPNSHSLNTDPTSTELQLVADTYSLSTITSDRYLELTGACFASTYPTHRITATVGGVATPVYDMSSAAIQSYGTCRNGRFNIVLRGASMKTGTNNIVLILTGYDSASVAATSGNAVARYTAIRSN